MFWQRRRQADGSFSLKKFVLGFLFIVIAIAAVTGWSYRPIAVTHPALQKANLPPIVPLREFFASTESKWRFKLSPDGKNLSWLESKWFKPALWVKPLEGDQKTIFHTDDEVRWYRWSADSRYLIYQADRDGWENDVLVSIDTTAREPKPRSYDFGKNVKSFLVQVPDGGRDTIIIAHNGRDRQRFDLYSLNLSSGETVSLGQSQQRGIYWHLSRKGEIYARTRYYDKEKWTFEINLGGLWKPLVEGRFEDAFTPLAAWDENNELFAVSNINRDKKALVNFNIDTGRETVLKLYDDVDVSGILMDRTSGKPQVLISHPGHQRLEMLDEELADVVSKLDRPQNSHLNFHTISDDNSKLLFSIEGAKSGFKVVMVDKTKNTVETISTPVIDQFKNRFSPVEPVSIPARDGLIIPAYLSRPKGVTDAAPLVIMIHGGPLSRAFGGWHSFRQLLNNRGYAVLDVNYRGSDGYGRAFREAAKNEVSRAMDDDITDARAWAVTEGIADPQKVAVFGGSFGGLKVLTAMTRNPDLYAAGIDINGISDLVSMRSEIPAYWQGWDFWYDKNLGDVNDPESRKNIVDRSPLTHAAKLTAPLMIIQGSNDVRVVRSQSDRMVAALREAGKPVDYHLLDGAGHQFRNWGWKTRMRTYRKIEVFLAKHLGGRADGFDYALFGADVLPKSIRR